MITITGLISDFPGTEPGLTETEDEWRASAIQWLAEAEQWAKDGETIEGSGSDEDIVIAPDNITRNYAHIGIMQSKSTINFYKMLEATYGRLLAIKESITETPPAPTP